MLCQEYSFKIDVLYEMIVQAFVPLFLFIVLKLRLSLNAKPKQSAALIRIIRLAAKNTNIKVNGSVSP